MATEADVKRALTEIQPETTVTLKLKDGTEVAGQLRQGADETVGVEADGRGTAGIKVSDIEDVVTLHESAGPE